MEEVFYGPWEVRVISKEASFDEQIVIVGSDASDGAYPGIPGGGPGPVAGSKWTLRAEWNDNAGSGWQPSDLRRSAAYTLDEGLVVTIGIDDNLDTVRDYDYNDVVVVCRSLDPSHTPMHPIINPYDFTVPKDVWWRYWKTRNRDPDRPYDGDPYRWADADEPHPDDRVDPGNRLPGGWRRVDREPG